MFHKLSEVVLEKRREELETFLHRLIAIPDIKVSDSLLAFLQSPQWVSFSLYNDGFDVDHTIIYTHTQTANTVKAREDVFADLMKKLTNGKLGLFHSQQSKRNRCLLTSTMIETGALVGKFIGESFESGHSQFHALM